VSEEAPSGPEVTVVVPTRRRPRALRDCLLGVSRQKLERSLFEVVVVDDGGQDAAEVAEELREALPVRALVHARRRGPGAARNAGAAAARGRFIAFIDDDCVPDQEWLGALLASLRRAPGALVGGRVVNALPDNPYSTTTQLIDTYVRDSYAQGRGREPFFTANSMALSAERFAELGGFDTSIPSRTAEDKDFCDRVRSRGYEMVFVPDSIVRHSHSLVFLTFLRQHYDYGRGILTFRLMRLRRGGRGFLPESLPFYVRLVLFPRRAGLSWRFVFLAILAQLATIAGALWAAAFERHPRTDLAAERAHGRAVST
jgi:glycosyltransferase involved in cell wall biosynthesis